MTEAVLFETRDGVATVTMNRPHRRNAIDAELASALYDALSEAAVNDAVRCVALTGVGGHFSVGGDLEAGSGGVASTASPDEIAAEIRAAGRASELLHEMPKPTLAVVTGSCAGAGLSLACAADIRVAADTARFSTAFIKAGVSGDFGSTWTLPRIVGPAKARELCLLAEKFDAREAQAIGLVSNVWSADAVADEAWRLACQLAATAPLAIAAMKANLNDSERTSFAEQLDAEAHRHAVTALTDDAVEAAAAFLEKRTPVFRGK